MVFKQQNQPFSDENDDATFFRVLLFMFKYFCDVICCLLNVDNL